MITLPDGVQAELSASADPIWVVRIRADAAALFGGIYSSAVYFSRPHSWSAMWSGSTQSAGALRADWIDDIEYSVRESGRGGLAQVGTAGFALANIEGVYDQVLRDAGYHYDGCRVEIYLTRLSETNYFRAALMFSGLIAESEVTDDQLLYKCETAERRYRKQVPPRTYERDSSTVWVADQIGDALIGKSIPCVFGHVDEAEGFTLSDAYNDGAANRGRLVNFCDLGTGGAYGIGGIDNLIFGDAGLKECSGGIAWIDTATGRSPWTATTGGSAYFTAMRPTDLYLRMLVKMRSWIEHDAKFVGVTGQLAAIDRSPTGAEAYIPPATNSSTDPTRALMFKIPPIGLSGTVNGSASANLTGLECYFVGSMYPEQDAGKWTGDFVTGPYNWRAWGAFVDNGTVVNAFGTYTPCWISAGLGSINNYNTPANWELYPIIGQVSCGYPTASYYDNLDDYSNGFFGVGVGTRLGTTPCGYLKCLEAALYIKFNIPWPTSGIMADMRGYLDSSGGLYTGTANALVENPAHLLAFVAGEFSQAGNANVDLVEAQAVASTNRSGWKFARQLMQKQDVQEVLADIADQAMLWSWVDHAGKFRVFPMSAPKDSGGAISLSRMYTLHRRQLVGGRLLKRSQTKMDSVHTSFVFKFHDSAAIGDFSATMFCRSGDASPEIGAAYSALCAAAKTRYTGGVDYDVEIEFPWIRDPATMALLAREIVTRETRRVWTIVWEADISDLTWELGDPFHIEPTAWASDPLPTDLLTAAFRVTGKRIMSESCRIQFTATEVF